MFTRTRRAVFMTCVIAPVVLALVMNNVSRRHTLLGVLNSRRKKRMAGSNRGYEAVDDPASMLIDHEDVFFKMCVNRARCRSA